MQVFERILTELLKEMVTEAFIKTFTNSGYNLLFIVMLMCIIGLLKIKKKI